VLALTTLSGACGPTNRAFTAHERKYKAGEYARYAGGNRPATGSIYSEAQSGYLEDTRALRVGDIVLVRINEKADAQGGATTNLSKDSKRSAGVDSLLGLVPAIQKGIRTSTPRRCSRWRPPPISTARARRSAPEP